MWLNCALLLAALFFTQCRVQRRALCVALLLADRYVTKQREFKSISVHTLKRTTLNLANKANSVHNLLASFTRLYKDARSTKHRITLTYFKTRIQWLCICRLLLITYTGCPTSQGHYFRRVFLMLNYTNITQKTYIQSWTVTEIMAREVWNFDSCYTLIDYQLHIKTGRNMWFL